MRAVLTKKNLLEGVRTAGHAISSRTTLPILGHVLVSTGDGSLRLSATDHQIGITTTVPAEILEPGELTLPASIGLEVISSLSDSDITLVSDDNHQTTILCPPSDFQILGLPPGEFPGLPEVPDTVWFEIDAKELKQGLRRTQFACSTDELRTILLGVLFSYSGDTLKLVATDTHRLAVDTKLIASGEGEANAVIPARAVAEVSRILTDEGKVRVHLSERQVMFVVGQIVVTASLIEGQYPNYERVVPSDFDKRFVLPTKLFTDAIKRASIVARADMNRTVVKTSGEKISVSARAGTVGKAYEEVEAIREGDDIEVAFNAQFMGEVLEVIDTEGVAIELSGALSPAVLRPVDQDDYLCVVMPMQIQE